MKRAILLTILEVIGELFLIKFILDYTCSIYFNFYSFNYIAVYIIWFVLILKILNVFIIKKITITYKYWKYMVIKILSFVLLAILLLVLESEFNFDILPLREGISNGDGIIPGLFLLYLYFPLIIILDIIQCFIWHKKKKMVKNTF